MSHRAKGWILAGIFLPLLSTAAAAKPAKCFATDDGHFDCDFQMTDAAGSFTIEGPEASYILLIDSPGRASGFVNLGTRNIPLAGTFVRESGDPACWTNDALGTRICAW